jgi:hypothetical protein
MTLLYVYHIVAGKDQGGEDCIVPLSFTGEASGDRYLSLEFIELLQANEHLDHISQAHLNSANCYNYQLLR